MKVFLEVTAPQKPPKNVEIKNDVLIGRGKTCNLRILSNEVSREHCRLIVREDSVAVHDLGSSNGTQVDGFTITAKSDIDLNSGAIIEIGPLKVVVTFEQTQQVVSGDAVSSAPTKRPTSDKTVTRGLAQTSEPLSASAVESASAFETAPAETEPGSSEEFAASAEVEEPARALVTPVADAIETTASDSEIPEFAEGEFTEDDDFADDEFAEIDDEPLQEFEEADAAMIDSDREVADATVSDSPPARKRSLFSFFRRSKAPVVEPNATEAGPLPSTECEDTPDEVTPDEAAPDEEATADQPVAIVEPEDDLDDAAIEASEEDAKFEAPDFAAVEFDADSFTEGELEEDEADDEDIDPGFSNFLNQIDS